MNISVANRISSRAQGLDHWRDVVCRQLIGIDVVAREPKQFGGRLSMQPVGEAALAHVETTAISAYRSDKFIADDPDPGFLINVLLSGSARTAQCGNQSTLQAGDIFLQDTSLPYSLELGTEAGLLTLRVPRTLIQRHLTPSERMCGLPLARDGIGRVAVASLLSLAEVAAHIEEADRQIALGGILNLIAAACSPLSSQARTSAHLGFHRANRYIESHLDDPMMSTGRIAAACGVTVRQLNRLFEAEEDTVSRTILRRRLERCRLDLVSPALAHRTIGEIAFCWGFNNLSHFSESFRNSYGVSPRAYRKQGVALNMR